MSSLDPVILSEVKKIQKAQSNVTPGGGDGRVVFDAPIEGEPPIVGSTVLYDGATVGSRRGQIFDYISSYNTCPPIGAVLGSALVPVFGDCVLMVSATRYNTTDNYGMCIQGAVYDSYGTRTANGIAGAEDSSVTNPSVYDMDAIVLSDNGTSAVVACFLWWTYDSKYYITAVSLVATKSSVSISTARVHTISYGGSTTKGTMRYVRESATSVLLIGAMTSSTSISIPTRRVTFTGAPSISTVNTPIFETNIDYAYARAALPTTDGSFIMVLNSPSHSTPAYLVTVVGGNATSVTPLTVTVSGAGSNTTAWLYVQGRRNLSRAGVRFGPAGFLAATSPADLSFGNPSANEWVLASVTVGGADCYISFTLQGTTLVGTVRQGLMYCSDGRYRDAAVGGVDCIPFDYASQASLPVRGFVAAQYLKSSSYDAGQKACLRLARAPRNRGVPVRVLAVNGSIATVEANSAQGIGRIKAPDGTAIGAPSYCKGRLLSESVVYPSADDVRLVTQQPVFVEIVRVLGANAPGSDDAYYYQIVDGVRDEAAKLCYYPSQYARHTIAEAFVVSDYAFVSDTRAVTAYQTLLLRVFAAEVV